jgi:hypothetical protein
VGRERRNAAHRNTAALQHHALAPTASRVDNERCLSMNEFDSVEILLAETAKPTPK